MNTALFTTSRLRTAGKIAAITVILAAAYLFFCRNTQLVFECSSPGSFALTVTAPDGAVLGREVFIGGAESARLRFLLPRQADPAALRFELEGDASEIIFHRLDVIRDGFRVSRSKGAVTGNRLEPVPASEVTGIRPFLLLPAALLTLLLAYLFFPGRRNRRSYRRAFLCGTLIGCAAFFVSFGWKVLDPERTAWLLGGGDPTQHYLGWVAFRNSAWHFPPGLTDMLANPHNASIVYTDSIPLFALAFKLFRAYLPERFQYLGLFGLSCFLLQGGFAALLLRRFTNKTALWLAGTLFFVFVPALFFRMYFHTSLAAHWVLLAAFALWLYCAPSRKTLLLWCLLGSGTFLIHPYLGAMVSALFCGQLLQSLRDGGRAKPLAAAFGVYLGAVCLAFHSAGGFYTFGTGDGRFGSFGSNLNTFFNPLQPDNLLKTQPVLMGQYEGQAFLGAGMLLLVLLAIYLTGAGHRVRPPVSGGFLSASCAAAGHCLLFAVSTKVAWNDTILFTVPLPPPLPELCSVFRSSGRFIWVPMYLAMLLAAAAFFRYARPGSRAGILAFLLAIQGWGLLPMVRESFARFQAAPVEFPVNLPLERLIRNRADTVRRLVILQGSPQELTRLAAPALLQGLPVGDFYFARPDRRTEAERNKLLRDLADGRPLPGDTIYLFKSPKLAEHSGLPCLRLGERLYAGIPEPPSTPPAGAAQGVAE